MRQVRACGYAVSDQESVMGLRVIAAPILDIDGHPYGALSLVAPSMACSPEEFVTAGAAPMLEAAGALSKILRLSGSSAVGMAAQIFR